MLRWIWLVAGLAFALLPSSAGAQSAGQALYDEGVKAYSAGDLATACPKFKASYEADRVAAPLFMLAKCQEKQGKIGSALVHYEEVMRLGGLEAELRDQAARSLNELAPRVPKLALRRAGAPAAAVATIDGVVFTIDGRPEPVDPGEHELVVSAPGHDPNPTRFSVKEGDALVLDIQVGRPLAVPEPQRPEPAAPEEPDVTPLWIGGGVAAGVGFVGFVVAGVTGGLILSECDGDLGCKAREPDFETGGLVIGNYVGWGVGAAGAATGAVLFIVAATRGPAPTGGGNGAALTAGPCPLCIGARVAF
jgi:hypothetical protein